MSSNYPPGVTGMEPQIQGYPITCAGPVHGHELLCRQCGGWVDCCLNTGCTQVDDHSTSATSYECFTCGVVGQ